MKRENEQEKKDNNFGVSNGNSRLLYWSTE